MPPRREGPVTLDLAVTRKDPAGRRQLLLHLPKDLCRRLKAKANQEKRTVSAQTELYLEVMLGLPPADEFALIQGYRATVGG
jgi:hypothetical protein